MLDKLKAELQAIKSKVELWEDEAKAEFEKLEKEFLDRWIHHHGGEVPIEIAHAAATHAHDAVSTPDGDESKAKADVVKPVEPTNLPDPHKFEDKKPDTNPEPKAEEKKPEPDPDQEQKADTKE